MGTILIHAAMVSALTASAAFAATPSSNPDPSIGTTVAAGEGAPGGRGVRLASAAAGTLLFTPEAKQSLLVTVGEGGEGGEGRRGKHFRKFRHHYAGPDHYIRRQWYGYDRRYYDRPYGYYQRDYDRRDEWRYYDRPYRYPPY
jgi:hypothetical protein